MLLQSSTLFFDIIIGCGKTTVARLFSDILISLGIRSNSQNGQVNTGNFVEVTGNQLVENGMGNFQAQLTSVIPGVMFIDEVYQS